MGLDIQLMGNVAGKVNQLHWVATFESLAELEASMGKLGSNSDYEAMVADAAAQGLFATGSFSDSIYRTLA